MTSSKNGAVAANRLMGGTRKLVLSDPAHLDYISEGLTDITGYTMEDLHELFDDEYARIVHPDDRDRFLAFDADMRSNQTTLSLHYRIVRKDGTVVRVQDTMSSHEQPDGTMIGYSLVVLADNAWSQAVADTASETSENDAEEDNIIPYGTARFSIEQSRFLGANDRFWEMLGSHDAHDSLHIRAEADPLNIIPAVDQARFLEAVRQAEVSDEPITFETHLWHMDGYLVEVAGWLAAYSDSGHTAFRVSLVDVTRERSRERENRRALRVQHFKNIYTTLFLFDVGSQTAQCFQYCKDAPFDTSGKMRVALSDAIDQIATDICAESGRQDLLDFLGPLRHDADAPHASDAAVSARAEHMDEARDHAHRRSRIEFDGLADGQIVRHEGVLVDAEAHAFYFGCRQAVSEPAPGSANGRSGGGPGRNAGSGLGGGELATVTQQPALSDGDRTTLLVAPSCDSGILAFSIEHNRANLRFFDIRSQSFFGAAPALNIPMALDDFLKTTPLSPEQFARLQEDGELTLADTRPDHTQRAWRLICKRHHEHGNADACVFGFELPLWAAHLSDDAPERARSNGHDIRVKTFGYFDIFVDGQAVVFSSAKSKELLALLVDRRGGFVSATDAIAHLWEDEPATSTVLARHRKIAMRLKNTLADYGVEHIVRTANGQRCLDVEAVQCDLFDYLAGKPDVSFTGTYMQNYSWGEVTLGELLTTMPFHA